jgi:cobalt-zinc-cadmium efflux system membrane fusion protein
MNRRQMVTCMSVASLLGVVALIPVFAHEGHGKVDMASFDLDAPRKVSPETAAIIGLQTVEVDFGAVESVLRLTGVVRGLPDRVQALAPRIAGSVVSISVRIGDQVHRGDLLAEIDSPDYLKLLADTVKAEGRVEQLQVEVEAGKQRAAVAEAELQRVESNPEAVSANLLSEKRSAAIAARSEARQREIELAQAGKEVESLNRLTDTIRQSTEGEADQTGRLKLLAAIDGVVIARSAVAGQGVEVGKTILEVADYATVQVEGELPESLVGRLSDAAGKTARIRTDADGEPVAGGIVRFISPVVDPIKRTTHLVIEAENPGGVLRDGMFVDVTLVLRAEKDAVVVPASAVLSDGPMHFVFVQQKEKDVFKKHDIAPGVIDDRVVEVLKGLAPGDVVVTQGAYSLTQLRPKVSAAAPTPGTPGEEKPSPGAAEPNPTKPTDDGHSGSH